MNQFNTMYSFPNHSELWECINKHPISHQRGITEQNHPKQGIHYKLAENFANQERSDYGIKLGARTVLIDDDPNFSDLTFFYHQVLKDCAKRIN